jgi:hypothetical protein
MNAQAASACIGLCRPHMHGRAECRRMNEDCTAPGASIGSLRLHMALTYKPRGLS